MDDRTDMVTTIPGLELRAGGRTWQATGGRSWSIGRAHEADIQLENPRVSRQHAVLQPTPAGWVLVNRSSNGMFVNGRRVESLPIGQPVTVVLGSASSGQALELHPVAAPPSPAKTQTVAPMTRPVGETTVARPPTAVYPMDQITIGIGRGTDNDVVLDDLLVSRHHAVLRRSGNQWELFDSNSANGTYVNGNRIAHAIIGPNDIVGIGHQLLHLSGDQLVEYTDTGDVSYEASNLRVVSNKGKVLLANVSFALPQRCFMAVVGPSGAGKSTLLSALTGFRPAGNGEVRYDNRDLYKNYAELRHRIGFVPQDDILHTQLTVRRALNYAAQLRFPQDVSARERKQRIDEVLGELGLTAHANQRIDSLSGGQRKRTSVALELLTKPSLLFLDEPTSGLDPGYEKSVMQTLRALADDGRSVVVVTHNTAQLNLCDRLLILAPGGRLAYFGPPQQALNYFGCNDFADLFNLLEHDTTTDWTGRYVASPIHGALTGPHATLKAPAPAARAAKPVAQQSAFAQFTTLCRRYLAVIAADRQYAVTLLVLPLLLSLFAHAVPGEAGLSLTKAIETKSTQPSQLLVLLIIGGALMGCAASIREIVKERAIYQREHGIGLSRGAYLASKLLVLSALTTLQGLILGSSGQRACPRRTRPSCCLGPESKWRRRSSPSPWSR
ncbi:ABC transporter ATP-binding protein [Mycobacterium stomatepiae]|uniref:ABC transporter ATP-binding protein n=1 Tax=Mycobacterium stomatepiae TaxID=470076 RepID=A0A7I7QFX8_9MYCO|nr:FHA domain-containing protein [Mycobacterium stomatepiae]BBY25138.1 ABC transporter ATP-binding protein [Mycobacterium stomatepiae]